MKTGRDIKFVIYQVLYIFVICVIALKGADINLEEVLARDKAVDIEIAEKQRETIDSLMKLQHLDPNFQIDTTKKYTEAEMQVVLAMLKDKSKNDGSISSNPITGSGPGVTTDFTGYSDPKTNETSLNLKAPVVPEFTQYTLNSIKNSYDKNLDIFGDGIKLTTIKPQSIGTLKINGEKLIKFEVDGRSSSKSTKEKQAPKIDIQKFISDGENASLRSIQNRVAYRVTIVSNFSGDLNVNISGPVKIDKVSSTQYDITLNFIASEAAFDAWTKGKTEPYKTSFTVSVKDKYNPKFSLSQMGMFTFGKW